MGIASLDAALSGLRVSQKQISVISNNVANVGTPGYTRKILPQASQSIQGETAGVIGNTVIRNVDLNLSRDLWTQISSVGELDVQKTYLSRIEQFHGDPAKEISIAAELSKLKDGFAALSDNPGDSFLQASTLNQAVDTANKINDFADLINTLRNDAQNEIGTTVERVNDILVQIADLNNQIKANTNINRTTALIEDKRDDAIKELSGLIDISFFKRGNGVLVVQTNEGAELASDKYTALTFDPTPLSAQTYYPESAVGLYVGDPVTDPNGAVDITTHTPGGKLGGLLILRDTTFPKQMAQLDELAQKMAIRMEAQGLTLFTDAAGAVPTDTAPDPTTLPLPTPVTYVGFAAVMRVNQAILDDRTLLQNGTYGATLNTGSNEVIRRVLQFGFGNVDYQQAENTDTNTQVDLLNTGGADLQSWLGLPSSNSLTGGRDLSAFTDVNALIASSNGTLSATNDSFRITFEETRTGLGPDSIDISLTAAQLQAGGNAAAQIVAEINAQIAALPVSAGLNAVASVSSNGQIVIKTSGTIEVDATNPVNPLTQTGLTFLGLSENIGAPIATTDPYFDVQVGNRNPVRITIEPGDTSAQLIAKLQAVTGLAVDTTNFALDGILRMRPGNVFDTPEFGGDIKITGGPFSTNAASYGTPPAATIRTSLDNGVNIASALFGTYTLLGAVVQNAGAVHDVTYGSDTDASLAAPIPTKSFRDSLLGPGANIQTGLIGSNALLDFSQKMINEQTQETVLLNARGEDEKALQDALQSQLMDQSGVNLDEELGHLITVQTAYSAAARVVSAIDDLFRELLNAI